MFRDMSDSPLLYNDEHGNLVVADNYEDILNTWTDKHSYSDYINQRGDGWSGEDLTYADMQYINQASTDYAKSKLVDLQKSLSHLSETEYNEFFEANPDFGNAVEGYLLELGQKKSEDDTWYETFNQDQGVNTLADEIESAQWFTPDDEYDGYMTIHGDTSDYGGGTYFKSNTLQPTKKNVENKGILLDAIKAMRDSEVSRGKWSQLDDMWLEHSSDGTWMLGENDGWSYNDYYEVRVHEGKAQVKVDGKWQNMSGSSSSIW
jgi:hypothetical protein